MMYLSKEELFSIILNETEKIIEIIKVLNFNRLTSDNNFSIISILFNNVKYSLTVIALDDQKPIQQCYTDPFVLARESNNIPQDIKSNISQMDVYIDKLRIHNDNYVNNDNCIKFLANYDSFMNFFFLSNESFHNYVKENNINESYFSSMYSIYNNKRMGQSLSPSKYKKEIDNIPNPNAPEAESEDNISLMREILKESRETNKKLDMIIKLLSGNK